MNGYAGGIRADTRPGPRTTLSILCVLSLGLAVAAIVRDARERRAWAAVAESPGRNGRQATLWETAGVVEGSAGAAVLVAGAVLDAAGAEADDRSNTDARALLLQAIPGRPGSALARIWLGRSAPSAGPAARWERPLELASAAAPGLDLAATELARRYLASWPSLSPEARRRAEATLRRACLNPEFLRTGLPVAVEVLGPEGAVGNLPDDPATLLLAEQILREAGGGPALELLAVRMKSRTPGAEATRPTP